MITFKNKNLKSVLESKSGLHLSAYIKFDGDLARFRKALNKHLKTAKTQLSKVLSKEEERKFLDPVEALGLDSDTLKQMKGNIGIFRKNNFLKFVSLPTDIQELCVVADTFHIKPLVKWAQQDQDFLLIGLTSEGAHLYKGSQSEMKKIDLAIHPESLKRWDDAGGKISLKSKRQLIKTELQNNLEWLPVWVDNLTRRTHLTVFVVGDKNYVNSFIKNFPTDNLYPENIAPNFSEEKVFEVCKNIRSLLRLDSAAKLNDTLEGFDFALKTKTVQSNLFQIVKAAINGKVEKLIVAEDLNLFGKIYKITGGIELHETDRDHEDDCLLDDLTQTVLINGGEVAVVKKNEIPQGHPLLAVLRGQQKELHLETRFVREAIV